MTKINLRYVDGFRDRHGRWRYYFRRGRGKRFPLPGLPLTVEFMRAYQSRLEKLEKNGPRDLVRGAPGTFNRLAIEYFQSSNCLGLAETTQRHYRYVIESVIEKENIGHRRVDEMSFEHVSRIVAKRASTPGAANAALQKIRLLVRYAIDLGWRNDDPTLRVRRFQLGTIHTWSDEEIETFEKAWSIGTLERTAFSLLLYTGQRESDVVRMAWGDIGPDGISVVQKKTGAKLTIPLHPKLQHILARWPRKNVTILTSSRGQPFTAISFGRWMSPKIDVAGLPDRCVPHGLRKAAARLLAEAGCSVKEIQAITGHASLSEIERYTKGADQRRLAASALARLTKQK